MSTGTVQSQGVAGMLSEPVFCLVEDRPDVEIGIKLLVLSLDAECPKAQAVLFHPCPSESLVGWLARFPWLRLIRRRLPGGGSADVKPHALLATLELGHDHVIWIDTDMMLAGDPRPAFRALERDVLGIAQEIRSAPHQGTQLRTQAWGWEVARAFPFTLNTCITRVTGAHRELLQAWADLLADERYTRHQSLPLPERPPHAMYDLDVLNAMLGSRAWHHVPVHVFPAGEFVIHSGGATSYTFRERLHGLFRPSPPILHALAMKPWVLLAPEFNYRGSYWWARRFLQEISPFVALARRYRHQVDDPCRWLDTWSLPGTIIRCLGFGHFALRGLPVAAFGEAGRWLRSLRPKPARTPQASIARS